MGAVRNGAFDCCVRHPIASSLRLAVAATLALQLSYNVERTMWTTVSVLAAPCDVDDTIARRDEEPAGALKVNVTAGIDLNLTMIFNCEGGDFEVAWSGAVNVFETIHIGNGTTVKIVGHGNPSDTSETVSDKGSIDITGARRHSSSQEQLDVLTARLSIPRRLTSAVVRVGSSAGSDKSSALGSIFCRAWRAAVP